MAQDFQLVIQKLLRPQERLVWADVPDPEGFVLYNMGGGLIYVILLSITTTFCTMAWFNLNFLVAVLPAIIGFGIWHFRGLYNEAKNTVYGLTNQRVLILHNESYRQSENYTVENIEMIQIKRINHQFSTIYFTRKRDYQGLGKKIGFIAITDVEQVAQHIKVFWGRES